jgi:hypothetical protein
MKKGKRITHIGAAHVVIRVKHLEELLERAAVTPAISGGDHCRKFVVYHLEEWMQLLESIKANSPTLHSRARGDCESWCSNVCSGNGGCDAGIGEPGECVAICSDGEVFIQ